MAYNTVTPKEFSGRLGVLRTLFFSGRKVILQTWILFLDRKVVLQTLISKQKKYKCTTTFLPPFFKGPFFNGEKKEAGLENHAKGGVLVLPNMNLIIRNWKSIFLPQSKVIFQLFCNLSGWSTLKTLNI